MSAPAAGLFDDATLVQQAQGGDREAFAQLYDRYFERVYDFVRRTLRNEADAADVTQEVFIKAMGSVGSLSNPAVFKPWLFTIARNLSISKIRGRRDTLSLDYSATEEGDATLSDIIPDQDIGGSPEAATERSDLASMVWAVAAGLDARQYTVLDLSVRQELGAEEMAEVLGVTRNNAYVMINRTKAAFSDACSDFMLYREGQRECPALVDELQRARIEAFSPEARKLLGKHVKRCDICGERKKRLPVPLAMFGGFALAAPPAGLRERIRGDLANAPIGSEPIPSLEGEGAALPGDGGLGGIAAGAAGSGGRFRRGMLFAAGAAGAILIALFAGVATLAVLDDDEDGAPVADADTEETATATATTPATSTPANTATPTNPAVLPAVVSPSPSATASNTPAPTNTPQPNATATRTPTRTPTPTATVTPTRTPTPTITPTPVTPSPTPVTPTIFVPPPPPPPQEPPPPPPPQEPPPPPALQITQISYCWLGTTDLRFTITLNGQNGESFNGFASYGPPPHTNFQMGGSNTTVTMFGNPYVPNTALSVQVQSVQDQSRVALRSIGVASPPNNQCQ